MNHSFKLYCVLISLLLANYSCRKDVSALPENTVQHNLGLFFEKTIKINQLITVYDSTSIKDSIDFVTPPSKNSYEWQIYPSNDCATFSGNFRKGLAGITFKCSGTYLISAMIYDSATRRHIGNTDTVQLNVTTDTLNRLQPIQSNDTLNLTPSIVKVWNDGRSPSNSPPDEVFIQIILSTSKKYDYYSPYVQFDIDSSVSTNNYSFNIASSIRLNSYPIAYGFGVKDIVWGSVSIHRLTIGTPTKISFTWLGSTYNGTLTLLNQNQFSFHIANAGAIRVR